MKIVYSFFIVAVLCLVCILGISVLNLHYLFGVIIPYAAILLFVGGVTQRVLYWARAPEPFRIPTTCGQQKTLPWIKSSFLEAPYSMLGVISRMALEVLFFRSLFRNTAQGLKQGPRLIYGSSKYLWAAALAFHWSFLIIFLRHFRFFAEPVPSFVTLLQDVDGFFQIGVPIIYATDAVILAALTFLFLRRVVEPKLKYISLVADYFALFLLFGIVLTGILMRYFYKTDIVSIKKLATGLLSFNPFVSETLGVLFYLHFFLVCTLMVYFPFSKLMHFAGVFLSPTRNFINNNREKRHINPWNYPVKVHTYEEWEEEFKDKLVKSGYPLEKE